MEQVFNVEESAQVLRISVPVAYDLVRSGKLHAVRAGKRQWRIPESALRKFLSGGDGGGSDGDGEGARQEARN